MRCARTSSGAVAWGIPAAALAVLLTACAVNPATGERQLSLVSESQEVSIGREAAEQIGQSMTMVEDEALQTYVADLGQTLAVDSERPDLPWSFQVVDDPTPNAFALPGGFIYVTRGMLNLMENEAELVSVLGHEIGHVTARHSVSQISRAQLAQVGMGLGMIFVPEMRPLADLAGLGLNLLMLKYSRDAERQADELGYRYARARGYDVAEMADVFAALERMSDSGGQSALPSWLATHPAPQERVEAVEARLAGRSDSEPGARVGRDVYLDHIDGLAYGPNPRNGFFRDGVFYHPELAFRFEVPGEWQTRNLARAVMAASPQGDAAMQLTLAPGDSPAAAMREFLAQQGVEGGPARERTINGLAAVSGAFQGRTQQATVMGLVTFVAHQDDVYQFVTYTGSEAFEQYRPLFEDIVTSFAPLEDPEILEVQAPVIRIITTDAERTLRELEARRPAPVPLNELAIINQLEDADATIPAGTRVKWVEGDPALLDDARRGR
ncbi:MAG: M48 family metalloprotease [Pseudomonadota bacterium]